MATMWCTGVTLALLQLHVTLTCAGEILNVAGIPEKKIFIPGRLMIGMLTAINQENADKNGCISRISVHRLEAVLLVANAIRELNAANLFNNTPIGLVVYDTCDITQFALSQAYRFLPRIGETPYAGVICCHKSELTLSVAGLLSSYQVPQIGTFTPMDILSDKSIYRYFLRLSPPNRFQVAAIVDIVRFFHWNYVSVLFEDGDYGEDIMKLLELAAEDGHFCLAKVFRIRQTMNESDYRRVFEELLQSEARVVVLAVRIGPIKRILPAAADVNGTREIIWIGTDSWGSYAKKEDSLFPAGEGALLLSPRLEYRPELNDFHANKSLLAQLDNDWWSTYHGIKVRPLADSNLSRPWLPETLANEHAAIHFDAIDTFLHALKVYFPQIGLNLSAFSPPAFLQVLRKSNFRGQNGPVRFTDEGDVVANFLLYHMIKDGDAVSPSNVHGMRTVLVGEWDAATRRLQLDSTLIRWLHDDDDDDDDEDGIATPASNCSRPCRRDEVVIQMTPSCCWESIRCRDNEITTKNRSECDECGEFTWPEATARISCVALELTYVRYTDVLGIVIIGFAAVGFSITCAVIVVFIVNNNKRLVRTTCREASYVLLVGILLDFSVVGLFPGEPSEWKCLALRFGFHLGCTMTYAPILIKTTKVFRIFVAGKRSTKAPAFIGPSQQFAVIIGIVAIEGGIVAASMWHLWPESTRIMPVKTEPLVEFTCQESFYTLLMGFSCNCVVIVCSAVLAIMARKLPANFNESMQIVICVYTTLILWIGLIPSYVTTPRASSKAMLLAVAIALNGFVPLLTLFGPKVYALYFVKETPTVFMTLK